MQIMRTQLDALVENQLPDGSRLIVDSENEKVFALNATAGAAWDACSTATTLSGVAEQMKHSLGDDVTEDVVEQAIQQLEEQNLVTTSGAPLQTRREVLTKFCAVALPVVVGLTLAEQRSYAQNAKSGTTAPKNPTPQPKCGPICQIINGLKDLGL
jgi:hypothetical protein